MSEQAVEHDETPEWKLERIGDYLRLTHLYQYPAKNVRVTFREQWRRNEEEEHVRATYVYEADLIAGAEVGDGVCHWLSSIGGTRVPTRYFEWEVSWTQDNANQPQQIARSVGLASEDEL